MRRHPINDAEEGLLRYIKSMVALYEMAPKMIGRKEALKRYRNLLKNGCFYDPLPNLPRPFRKMKNKECYRNASLLATAHDAQVNYVEGYALCIIPVSHAWVTPITPEDGKGIAIDPTWTKRRGNPKKYPPAAYFGIEKNSFELSAALLENEVYGAHFT